jgi:hypothetical protein
LYIDEAAMASEVLESTNVEYLVKNPQFTYKWQRSKSGKKIMKAMELQDQGQWPTHIGLARINDHTFIGKVRHGEDLNFIDQNGKQRSTSSFKILTCTSPTPERG